MVSIHPTKISSVPTAKKSFTPNGIFVLSGRADGNNHNKDKNIVSEDLYGCEYVLVQLMKEYGRMDGEGSSE